jgi:hypothetical protein
MFPNSLNSFQNIQPLSGGYSENMHARQYNAALNQFRSILRKGKVFRLKSKILSRRQYLYDLNALKPDLHLRGSSYTGIQVVSIHSIIGSEGRSADFDMGFHPLNEAARDRWVNMAMAYLARLPLPPIELIQVGSAYFVRDGHHRISVARAFGQIAMDAEVIAWKASPPFPWQAEVAQNTSYPLKSFNPSV